MLPSLQILIHSLLRDIILALFLPLLPVLLEPVSNCLLHQVITPPSLTPTTRPVKSAARAWLATRAMLSNRGRVVIGWERRMVSQGLEGQFVILRESGRKGE